MEVSQDSPGLGLDIWTPTDSFWTIVRTVENQTVCKVHIFAHLIDYLYALPFCSQINPYTVLRYQPGYIWIPKIALNVTSNGQGEPVEYVKGKLTVKGVRRPVSFFLRLPLNTRNRG